MTVDEAIAAVKLAASGRTRFEGDEPWRDEILVAEIERLNQGWHEADIQILKTGLDRANLRSLNTELVEALSDTLRMLEACHRQLGMYTKDNKRTEKARAVLAKAADASAKEEKP
jgi:galactokinase